MRVTPQTLRLCVMLSFWRIWRMMIFLFCVPNKENQQNLQKSLLGPLSTLCRFYTPPLVVGGDKSRQRSSASFAKSIFCDSFFFGDIFDCQMTPTAKFAFEPGLRLFAPFLLGQPYHRSHFLTVMAKRCRLILLDFSPLDRLSVPRWCTVVLRCFRWFCDFRFSGCRNGRIINGFFRLCCLAVNNKNIGIECDFPFHILLYFSAIRIIRMFETLYNKICIKQCYHSLFCI